MRRALALLVVSAALSASRPAAADVDGSDFSSAEWHVSMTAPRNWQLSEHSSYPNVLLWMSRRSPAGKMLFTAERVPAGETALSYARRTSRLLATMGFRARAPQLHSATGAYWIDFQNRATYLRQAFLVADGIGYSLTLSAGDSRGRSQHLRSFDAALRSIRVRAVGQRDDASEDDAATPTAGADAGATAVPPPAAGATP